MHRILPLALLALAVALPSLAQASLAQASLAQPSSSSASNRADASASGTPALPWIDASVATLEKSLVATHGEAQSARIRRGLTQVARLWTADDGDASVFESFVSTNFAGDQPTIDALFSRLEAAFEALDGHMLEIGREFRRQSDLDLGPLLPIDQAMAGYSPSAHVTDDLFRNKLAFIVVLNFPLTTLEQRQAEGGKWTRRQWAEARLADRFARRIPASVYQEIARALAASEEYVSEYNIWMHHLVDERGVRQFPKGMRLLSHWNLRDQIKADYSEGAAGLARQRAVVAVMDHIVAQTIPQAVIDNPTVDWNVATNQVTASAVKDYEVAPRAASASPTPGNAREPDTRYGILLGNFRAFKLADPYSPTAPTQIARRFDDERELSEDRVRAMLEQVVTSPLVPRVAKLIEARLGRPLEPHDIWYNGFRARGAYTEQQLDAMTRKRYPDAAAFKADMPAILGKIGFAPEKARFLAERIEVDPARGSGHAMPAARRGDFPRLRTRIAADGMDYKGFNIAIHEFGHNVEQVFSLYGVDHTLLQGVPNTAFTEALAFVFQAKDLEVLGLVRPDPASRALATLNDFWGTYEIAGVALVDMAVWRWMYEHPEATPSALRDATLGIARDTWNRYYAPVFGRRDVALLGVYSHMLNYPLYLPDYPLGHMIAHQISEQIERAGSVGGEFERMATMGRITPDEWMKQATGAPVGPDALLAATERALAEIK